MENAASSKNNELVALNSAPELPQEPNGTHDLGDSDSDESINSVDSIELIGRHYPTLAELRQMQSSIASALGTIGVPRYKERLLEWYNGSTSLPFFMDLPKLPDKAREWVRESPRVFFLNNLPNLPRPEGFFSIAELSVPDISFPELSLPELSLPEFHSFLRLSELVSERKPLEDLGLDLTEADLDQSFTPDGQFGCEHYTRNCKVHCITCNRFHPCRQCHDEVENHPLPRQETKYMLCYFCQHPQTAAQFCAKCDQRMASYYCPECKLWSDDDSKPIFHCKDCGICRIGQGLLIDTYHCNTCGVCMDLADADQHKCIERSTHSNCPICLQFMFNSTETLVFMKCGHPMHKTCYDVYTEQSYRCPLCLTSIVDTSALFRVIDDEVAQEQLPEDLAKKRVDIKCCDCRGRSRVPFHIAGLKCAICRSYNTVKL